MNEKGFGKNSSSISPKTCLFYINVNAVSLDYYKIFLRRFEYAKFF